MNANHRTTALWLGLLALSGCGGDDDGSPAEPPSPFATPDASSGATPVASGGVPVAIASTNGVVAAPIASRDGRDEARASGTDEDSAAAAPRVPAGAGPDAPAEGPPPSATAPAREVVARLIELADDPSAASRAVADVKEALRSADRTARLAALQLCDRAGPDLAAARTDVEALTRDPAWRLLANAALHAMERSDR